MPARAVFHKVNDAMEGRLLQRIAEMREQERSWDEIAYRISIESTHRVSRGSIENWHTGQIPARPKS